MGGDERSLRGGRLIKNLDWPLLSEDTLPILMEVAFLKKRVNSFIKIKKYLGGIFMNAHSYALDLEEFVRSKVPGLNRGDIFGFVDADSIESHPYWSLVALLMYFCKPKTINKKGIEKFIEDYYPICDCSVSAIIQKNGVATIAEMQQEFKDLF